MLHQTIQPAPSLIDSMQRASHQLTVAEQRDLAIWLAKELCARDQVALVRVLAGELSFSYGADRIEQGCSFVESDLDDEEAAVATGIPHLPQYERRAVALNPEAWS